MVDIKSILSSSYENMSKEQLIDMIVDLSNKIYEQNKDIKYYYIPIKNKELLEEYYMAGDCMAQCLNCIRLGHEDGYACKCGNPQWTMDSSAIRKAEGKV